MPPPGTSTPTPAPNSGPTPTPAPTPAVLGVSADIVKSITTLRNDLQSSVDHTKDLAKQLGLSSTSLKTSYELSTDVKHTLDDTRTIATKLGRSYIDQDLILERINTNQLESVAIQTELEDVFNKVNAARSAVNLAPLQTEADLLAHIEQRLQNIANGIGGTVSADERAFALLMKEKGVREEIDNILKRINGELGQGNVLVKEAQLKASVLAKIFGQLTGIPFLKDFMDFQKISDAFKKSNKEGFDAMGEEIMRVVKSPLFLLAIGLTAIVGIIKSLVKAALEFDKQLTEVANNLGISQKASIGILDNFREISKNNENIVKGLDSAYLSVKNQTQATAELQEILGTNAMFTNRMVQSQILLTKQMKLSKEESAGIQKLSILSGKSAEDILQNSISQNKTAISYKKIISDIAKVNSEISVMYKNNPELIAKAVIEANKLGLSLEQTQQISKSLLDFETSIAGELEAELLTGQRFNFEKARALALDGKSVEAAKELMDQMGGLNGLTKLNVIQRDRLAASIGMSAAELTNAAREQEILNKLGFENRKGLEEQYALLKSRNDTAGIALLMEEARKKEGGEVLLQDIARANLQERFQETLERIKQIFTEIAAGPIINMIEGLAKFLQNTTLLKGLLVGVSVVMGAIAAAAIAAAYAITVATGGANLASLALIGGGTAGLLGGLALTSSAFGGSTSSINPESKMPTIPKNENRADNEDNRRELEKRMGSLSYTTQSMSQEREMLEIKKTKVDSSLEEYKKTLTSVTSKSPEITERPKARNPYEEYEMENRRRDDRRDVASNTDQNRPIENKVFVYLDGQNVTIGQKKVDYRYT